MFDYKKGREEVGGERETDDHSWTEKAHKSVTSKWLSNECGTTQRRDQNSKENREEKKSTEKFGGIEAF